MLCSAPMAAQDSSRAHLWRGIVREPERPDYVREVLPPALQPIRLPAPPAGVVPPVVRGLYVNAWIFGSRRFYDIVRLADTTEVNALTQPLGRFVKRQSPEWRSA